MSRPVQVALVIERRLDTGLTCGPHRQALRDGLLEIGRIPGPVIPVAPCPAQGDVEIYSHVTGQIPQGQRLHEPDGHIQLIDILRLLGPGEVFPQPGAHDHGLGDGSRLRFVGKEVAHTLWDVLRGEGHHAGEILPDRLDLG